MSEDNVGASAYEYAKLTFNDLRVLLDSGEEVVFDADLQKAIVGDELDLEEFYEDEIDNLTENGALGAPLGGGNQ